MYDKFACTKGLVLWISTDRVVSVNSGYMRWLGIVVDDYKILQMYGYKSNILNGSHFPLKFSARLFTLLTVSGCQTSSHCLYWLSIRFVFLTDFYATSSSSEAV